MSEESVTVDGSRQGHDAPPLFERVAEAVPARMGISA